MRMLGRARTCLRRWRILVILLNALSKTVMVAFAMASAFAAAFKPHRMLRVGGDGIGLEEFLLRPASHWIERSAHGS